MRAASSFPMEILDTKSEMLNLQNRANNNYKDLKIREVTLKRRCCVWHNTEAVTPPQPLHKRGQHGGGRPLRKRFTLIYCIIIACLVLAHGPRNRPYYSLLPTLVFWVGSGSSVGHASGGVGGVLASLSIMVKECCC